MGVMIKPQKPKLLLYLFTQIFLASDIISGRQYHRLVLDKDQISALRTQQEYVRNNSIKTIQFAYGDVYDCVDIYKQPSFLHPMFKDHKLQMRPTVLPAAPSSTSTGEDEVWGRRFLDAEIWSEDKCPEGSVPIQRLDLDAVASRKYVAVSKAVAPDKVNEDDMRFWALRRSHKRPVYGGGAAITVYAVPDVGPEDVSGGMMWVSNEDTGVSLITGWTVEPEHFNDTKTRLFINWQTEKDATVCYNAECLGFFLLSPTPVLGKVLNPLSTYLGQQYVIRVYIHRDPDTGHWWLAMGSARDYVGYWHKAILHNLEHLNQVEFGGFVYCPPHSKRRCPYMGNGILPSAHRRGYHSACVVDEAQYFDQAANAHNFTKRQMSESYVTDTFFADVSPFRDGSCSFAFGGPGY